MTSLDCNKNAKDATPEAHEQLGRQPDPPQTVDRRRLDSRSCRAEHGGFPSTRSLESICSCLIGFSSSTCQRRLSAIADRKWNNKCDCLNPSLIVPLKSLGLPEGTVKPVISEVGGVWKGHGTGHEHEERDSQAIQHALQDTCIPACQNFCAFLGILPGLVV